MRQSLYDYCVSFGKESLIKSWDNEKNAPMTPREISYGSNKKVWWKCENGHSFAAPPFSRTAGSGCPYCTGRLVLSGENDLFSQHPELIRQWDYEKNTGIDPKRISVGAHRKVWWICEKGHEWQAAVRTRVNGCGCPYCTGRSVSPGENDLATTNPELVHEWDFVKNKHVSPDAVSAGSKKKVWWICEKGHEWQAKIFSRAQGCGCPVCAGKVVVPNENDLKSQFPAIAAQWHPTKNGTWTPENCAPSSNRKAWWICPLGHEYQAAVGARTVNNSACPYCAGRKVLKGFNDLATTQPVVASSWHPTLNGTLTPEMVTSGSHRKVWWRCSYGHVWKAVIASRTGKKKCGCPVCAGRVKASAQIRYAAIVNTNVNTSLNHFIRR